MLWNQGVEALIDGGIARSKASLDFMGRIGFAETG